MLPHLEVKEEMNNLSCITVTASSPINIALVKYWGKRDEEQVLPLNSSISVTLDSQHLCTKTTVSTSKTFIKDRMWLNGTEHPVNARVLRILNEVRRRARKRKTCGDSENDLETSHHESMLTWHVHISSENNFPTAAGLASSASGYSCLAFSLARLYRVEDDLSSLARLGSGSACRSVYGGFVMWDKGEQNDGSDSVAKQIASASHWPELRVIIVVTNHEHKCIGSSDGMQLSVKTSDLLRYRAEHVVPTRCQLLNNAIQSKDFSSLANLTMKDSNQLHAVCMDTYPPIKYLNSVSHEIIQLVHSINNHYNQPKVAYTFDAGPNACLFTLTQDVDLILSILNHKYSSMDSSELPFIRGLAHEKVDFPEVFSTKSMQVNDRVHYLIHTQVGEGPRVEPDTESLLNPEGQPLL